LIAVAIEHKKLKRWRLSTGVAVRLVAAAIIVNNLCLLSLSLPVLHRSVNCVHVIDTNNGLNTLLDLIIHSPRLEDGKPCLHKSEDKQKGNDRANTQSRKSLNVNTGLSNDSSSNEKCH
jgi:hypothetical protein